MQKCLYYNHFDTRLSVVLSKNNMLFDRICQFHRFTLRQNTTTIQKDYEVSQSN